MVTPEAKSSESSLCKAWLGLFRFKHGFLDLWPFWTLPSKTDGSDRLHSLEKISDCGFLGSRKLKSIAWWLGHMWAWLWPLCSLGMLGHDSQQNMPHLILTTLLRIILILSISAGGSWVPSWPDPMSLLGIATSSQDNEKTGGLLYELFWHLWWRKRGAEFLCLLLVEGGVPPGQQLYFRSADGKWFSRDSFIVQELYSQVSCSPWAPFYLTLETSSSWGFT